MMAISPQFRGSGGSEWSAYMRLFIKSVTSEATQSILSCSSLTIFKCL